MLDTLKQILSTGTVERVEEYKWKGQVYVRVFMTRRKDCAWDGPKTDAVLKIISEAHEAEWQREKKGTR